MVCPFVGFSWRHEHPIIQLDSIQKTKRYQVMATFYSRIYRQEEIDVFVIINIAVIGLKLPFKII